MTSRKWVGTLNNWTQPEYDGMAEPLRQMGCKFLVIGKEVGEQGTPHLQMYFYFENPKSLKQMKKLNGRTKWEFAKGTCWENQIYCSKDGDFEMLGEPPMDQDEKGQCGRDYYEEAWEHAKKGEIEQVDAHIRITCYSALKKIHFDYMEAAPMIEECLHEWHWGPTGTFKSKPIQCGKYGIPYVKDPETSWWDGYTNQETVLIEDFGKNNAKMGDIMKRWVDYFAFNAQYKGTQRSIRPRRIIVTSNYTIEDIWTDPNIAVPLNRRFTVYEHKTGDTEEKWS
nr:MAG: replication associated protein [Cressdnaviricota sp.]